MSKRGLIVHDNWSLQLILRALKAAPEDAVVKIMQTWIPEEDFAYKLKQLYRDDHKRFALRVMLIDPNGENNVLAARVKLRWEDPANAPNKVTESAMKLLRLQEQLELDTHGGPDADRRPDSVDVKIRLYDFLPFGPIYKIGEEVMFVGFYLNHTTSVSGPMLELRRKSAPEKIWHDFDQNLRSGWEIATPYSPQDAKQQHP